MINSNLINTALNTNNMDDMLEILNATQTEAADIYTELTEGDLNELFADLDAEVCSSDWLDRDLEAVESNFDALQATADHDISDTEFNMLMDQF